MLNKTKLSLLSLLLVNVMAFAQPSKKMLNSIPNESYCVVSLNLENIVNKIEIDRIKSLPVIKTAFEELKKGARKDSVTLKKFYNDPNSLGVALEPSISAFFHFTESEHEDPIGFAGVMIPLKNRLKFDLLLKNVLQGKYDEVQVGKGYKFISQSNMNVAWNKNFLTFYTAFSHKGKFLLDEHLERLYKAKKKTSLLKNQDYKTFVKRQNDFSVWFDVIKLEQILKRQSKELANNNFFSLETTSLDFEMNFEDGKIAFLSKRHYTPEMQGLVNRSYNQRVDVDMLKYVSQENLLGFAGFSFDLSVMKEMYEGKHHDLYDSLYNKASREIIKSVVKEDSTLKVWRESLHENNDAVAVEVVEDVPVYEDDEEKRMSFQERDSVWNKIYAREDSLGQFYYDSRDSIINSVLGKYDLKKEDLWTLFTGDVLFASNGTFQVVDTFQTYEYVENQDGEWEYNQVQKTRTFPAPLFKLLVGVNYGTSVKSALDDIIGRMQNEMDGLKIEKKKDYFVIDAKYTNIYLTVFDEKYILLTNNQTFFDEVKATGYTNNLATTKTYDYLTKGGSTFFYADIKAILKKTEKGEPKDIAMFKIFEKTFQSFDAGNKPDNRKGYTGFSAINMANKKENALHILFDLANEIYLYSMSFK